MFRRMCNTMEDKNVSKALPSEQKVGSTLAAVGLRTAVHRPTTAVGLITFCVLGCVQGLGA